MNSRNYSPAALADPRSWKACTPRQRNPRRAGAGVVVIARLRGRIASPAATAQLPGGSGTRWIGAWCDQCDTGGVQVDARALVLFLKRRVSLHPDYMGRRR